MIKRPILITIFFLTISASCSAQNFLHSVGVSGAVMRATLKGPLGYSGRFGMTFIHANYFPRASFPLNYFSSVSVGVPFGIGAGFIDNNFLNVKGTYLSYDIPFVIDYNVGFKAAENGDDRIGFYFGLGYGITHTNRDTLGVTPWKANSSGLLARAGVRLGFPEDFKQRNRGISIGIFHKLGGGEEKFKTSGLNLLFDF